MFIIATLKYSAKHSDDSVSEMPWDTLLFYVQHELIWPVTEHTLGSTLSTRMVSSS